MPRVDAIGISSAGIYVNNRTMVASLFNKVPRDLFDEKVKDIYIRAVKDTFGDGDIHELIFDERPYRVYDATVSGAISLSFICFEEKRRLNKITKGCRKTTFLFWC